MFENPKAEGTSTAVGKAIATAETTATAGIQGTPTAAIISAIVGSTAAAT
jgi:hypothetical protein